MDDFAAYVGVIDQVQMDCVCVCVYRKKGELTRERKRIIKSDAALRQNANKKIHAAPTES